LGTSLNDSRKSSAETAEWRMHHYTGALLILVKEKHQKENPVTPDVLCQQLTTLIAVRSVLATYHRTIKHCTR